MYLSFIAFSPQDLLWVPGSFLCLPEPPSYSVHEKTEYFHTIPYKTVREINAANDNRQYITLIIITGVCSTRLRVVITIFKNYNYNKRHIFFLSRLIFPAVVTLVVTTLTFPPGFGQFMAGEVRL